MWEKKNNIFINILI